MCIRDSLSELQPRTQHMKPLEARKIFRRKIHVLPEQDKLALRQRRAGLLAKIVQFLRALDVYKRQELLLAYCRAICEDGCFGGKPARALYRNSMLYCCLSLIHI